MNVLALNTIKMMKSFDSVSHYSAYYSSFRATYFVFILLNTKAVTLYLIISRHRQLIITKYRHEAYILKIAVICCKFQLSNKNKI